MLRQLLVGASLVLAAQLALAGEAGHVIFVAGDARLADKVATLGAAVQEGDLLTTAADGYVYIKTIDAGLFILRPNTKARITTYHVDTVNPANTKIKLELLSGVARSKSGDAVKFARQNFRFNTPVAAIGVRGTDFTVSTDQNTSRIAVFSGGIVASGFVGACRPEGSGPCEGTTSQELSATQKGQLLQIQRGQAAPQLLQGGALSPDTLAPPRVDEPISKSSVGAGAAFLGSNEPSLDPQKTLNLQQHGAPQPEKVTPPPPPPPPPVAEVVPTPPVVVVVVPPVAPPVVVPPVVVPPVVVPVVPPVVVVPPPVVVPPVVVVPDPVPVPVPPPVVVEPPPPVVVVPPREVTWGRWRSVIGLDPTSGSTKVGADKIASNDYFALFRSKDGSVYATPQNGSVGFTLGYSEAYVRNQTSQVVNVATLQNGQLMFNFDKATFTTSFDLLNQSEHFKMASTGAISRDGRFAADNKFLPTDNMTLNGVLGSDHAAAYLFKGTLDANHVVSGLAVWGR